MASKKRSAWLLAAAGLVVVSSAEAQPKAAPPQPGADVLAAFFDLAGWLRASGGGELVTSGPPEVSGRADGEGLRLPGLALRTPEAVVSFGDVELVRSDRAGGLWRLTGTLPPRVTVETPDLPPVIVTTGRSSFDVEIDPRNGMFGDSLIKMADLVVAMDTVGRMSIAGAQLGGEVGRDAGGKATLTSSYRLDGLSMTLGGAPAAGPATEIARAGSIVGTSRLDGVDWDRLAALQSFVLANQAAMAAGENPELARRFEALATTPDLVIGGFEVRFGVEDVWVGEVEEVGSVAVAKAGFHFGVSGLTGASAGASFGYGHEGLKMLSPLPVDAAAVPETLGFEIAVDRLPGTRLVELLGAEDEERLLEAIREAGTTARVTGARIRMNGMGADLDLEVTASATAPDGVTGRAELAVVNLDRIVRALGPLVADEMAAIQLAAVLGQRSEEPGGRVTHRWSLARHADGLTTLNGNDVGALIGDGMAMLDRDSGAKPSAAGPGDEAGGAVGITAELVAARLEEYGIAATIAEDDAGDPAITAALADALDGETLGVQFFDCGSDGVCGSGMLHLTLESAEPVPLARVNEWNSDERWVRAYRGGDGELWLEMDIAGEGATAAAVDGALGRFLESAERFLDEVVAGR